MGIPLAVEKIEGPTTYIIYLGIAINSLDMTIEITPEKYHDCLALLLNWSDRRTCTKRQIKSLIGKLSFISKVVRPGRMFFRRLIDLSTTVKLLHHHITLNKESRADVQWWIDFLPHWTATTMIPPSLTIESSDMQLHTDASNIGYGAVFGHNWIQGSWSPIQLARSISYKELYAIVAASLTWGHLWTGKRVVFITDNKPITQVWDSGTSRCPDIMSLIRPLYLHAASNGFCISFKHIFGLSNPIADALSRFQMPKFRSLLPSASTAPTTIPAAVSKL